MILPTMESVSVSRPGPKDARAWRIGLGCLAFVSAIPAALAAPVFFAWLALGRYEPRPFPTFALIYYVPAIVSIALGIWTWRTKRVRWVTAGAAIFAGLFGLSMAVVFALFGLLARVT